MPQTNHSRRRADPTWKPNLPDLGTGFDTDLGPATSGDAVCCLPHAALLAYAYRVHNTRRRVEEGRVRRCVRLPGDAWGLARPPEPFMHMW